MTMLMLIADDVILAPPFHFLRHAAAAAMLPFSLMPLFADCRLMPADAAAAAADARC